MSKHPAKLSNEPELLKEAIRVGMIYAEKRGVAKFEKPTRPTIKLNISTNCWYTTNSFSHWQRIKQTGHR